MMKPARSWRPALLALLLSFSALPAAADSPAATVPIEHLQGLGTLEYTELASERLGRSLHVFVRLPDGYETVDEALPAVYVLDGGGLLPLLAGQYHYLSLGDELPPLILVGISYGATTFREGNMRQTDFTAPAPDRDFWGGAGTFQAVLREELLPLVERRYRADPQRRILFGQSLGGQFVLFSAVTEPALFRGCIASNPALHRNLDFFLQWRGEGPVPRMDSRLFVSVGALDDPRIIEPAVAWRDHWAARERPWTLEFRSFEGQTHFSAAAEAFTQGMKWLLAAPGPGR